MHHFNGCARLLIKMAGNWLPTARPNTKVFLRRFVTSALGMQANLPRQIPCFLPVREHLIGHF